MSRVDLTNLISLTLGVAGVAGTIYYGRKALRLEKKLRRFDWIDIESGIRFLMTKTSGLKSYDMMVCVSGPGAIISNLLIARSERNVPLYAGISVRNDEPVLPSLPERWRS